ncbi:MAG: hypothetical protein WCF18_12525, partial [Chthoniobacteraceae bacterium]
MKTKTPLLSLAVAMTLAGAASAQIKGPSTGSTPYVLPASNLVTTYSIATVDNTGANPDDVFAKTGGGTYSMSGIPDGLGAYDNGNGTFTLLMNHEISAGGVIRDHGAAGSFVSEWIINKNNLSVVSASDLIKNVIDPSGTVHNAANGNALTFARFCSADLPAVSAFSFGGLGTTERIFMHGEEGSATGWQQATVATGAGKGNSYILGKFNLNTNGSATSVLSPVQLNVATASTGSSTVTYAGALNTPVPRELAVGAQLLGQTIVSVTQATNTITLSGPANANISSSTPTNFTLGGVGAWENALANPFAQTKTVVIGNNDGGTGIMNNSVSVYVGTKTSSGTEADRAGLTNGTLSFVNVVGNPAEIVNTSTRATNITNGTRFNLSGTSSTAFSRPEDGAWNPQDLS